MWAGCVPIHSAYDAASFNGRVMGLASRNCKPADQMVTWRSLETPLTYCVPFFLASNDVRHRLPCAPSTKHDDFLLKLDIVTKGSGGHDDTRAELAWRD